MERRLSVAGRNLMKLALCTVPMECFWKGRLSLPFLFLNELDVNNPQKVQYDKNEGDNEQYVDQVTELRKRRAYSST